MHICFSSGDSWSGRLVTIAAGLFEKHVDSMSRTPYAAPLSTVLFITCSHTEDGDIPLLPLPLSDKYASNRE